METMPGVDNVVLMEGYPLQQLHHCGEDVDGGKRSGVGDRSV